VPVDIPTKKYAKKKEEEDYEYVPENEDEEEEDSETVSEQEAEDDQTYNEGKYSESDEEEIPAETKSLASTLRADDERKKKLMKKPAVTPERQRQQNSDAVKRKIRPTGQENVVKKRKVVKHTDDEGDVPMTTQEMADSVETKGSKDGKKGKKNKDAGKDGEEIKEVKEGKKYNDKNVDFNLYNEAPENIIETKVKLSSNVMMMSKMIEATGEAKGLTYDMAALVIVRRLKNGDKFEFNLPLNLAANIKTAIDYIMQKNRHFFDKKNQIGALN